MMFNDDDEDDICDWRYCCCLFWVKMLSKTSEANLNGGTFRSSPTESRVVDA